MNFSDLPANLPAWASTDEAACWFYGFAIAATVRVFRAVARWVRRISSDAS